MKKAVSILLILMICISMSSCSLIEEWKISSMSEKELLHKIAIEFQNDNFEEALKYTEWIPDEPLKEYYKEYINYEISFASFNGTTTELYDMLERFFEISEDGDEYASGYSDDIYLIWDWHKEQKESFETDYIWIESAFEWLPRSTKLRNDFDEAFREVLTDSINLLGAAPNSNGMVEIPYSAVIRNTQKFEALKEETLSAAEEISQAYAGIMAQDDFENIVNKMESASKEYYEKYAYEGIDPDSSYEIDYEEARNRYLKSEYFVNISVNSGSLSDALYRMGIELSEKYYYCGVEGYDNTSLPTYLLATFLCGALDIPMDNVVINDFFDY